MLKACENPPILYPEGANLPEIAGQWWVAHTKSRAEKVLAQALRRWEVPYFLPLVEKTTRRNGRVFKSMLPLFGGYIFFNGNEESRYRALTTNRIAQVIEVVDQQRLICEMAGIHRALNTGLPVEAYPHLKAGVRCRVKAGPLMGCEGRVVRNKNVTRFLIDVEILGQSAAVEIDGDLLETIE